MKPAAVEPVEIRRAEPDLIDRIANAIPEDLRAEYYRELRHCRSLPENDEMLRLLRAMQFLVLLIEQAPSRVAEERERLEKLLGSAVENITRMSSTNEAYHAVLRRELMELPAAIADGISPKAVADEIREILRHEFMQSTIPGTADVLGKVAGQMKNVCSEFAVASDNLSSMYGGAAENAREAVESLKSEIDQAKKSAARYTTELAAKFSRVYCWSLAAIAGGSLVMGLALGMMLERAIFFPAAPPAVQPVVQEAQPEAQTEPEPKGKTPPVATKAAAGKQKTAEPPPPQSQRH